MDKKKTGALIREARLKKNYTQTELGDLIFVTNKAVSRWEQGKSFPDVVVLERLADVLDLEIKDIVTGEMDEEIIDSSAETVSLSKKQNQMMLKKYISIFFEVIIMMYILFLGIEGLTSLRFVDTMPSIIFFVSYVLIVGLICTSMRIKNDVECRAVVKKVDMRFLIISLILYIFEIIVMNIAFLNVEKILDVFNIQPSSLGAVLNKFLQIVFLINLILMIYFWIKMEKREQPVDESIMVMVGTLVLTCLNGNLLRTFSNIEDALKSLWINIGIISVEMVLVIIIVMLIRQKIRKSD